MFYRALKYDKDVSMFWLRIRFWVLRTRWVKENGHTRLEVGVLDYWRALLLNAITACILVFWFHLFTTGVIGGLALYFLLVGSLFGVCSLGNSDLRKFRKHFYETIDLHWDATAKPAHKPNHSGGMWIAILTNSPGIYEIGFTSASALENILTTMKQKGYSVRLRDYCVVKG